MTDGRKQKIDVRSGQPEATQAPTPNTSEMFAAQLSGIFHNGPDFKKIGNAEDWIISYVRSSGNDEITMMHDGNGSILGFQFKFMSDPDGNIPVLSLLNLHREAGGYGRETMQFLKPLSQAIANQEKCRVDLVFPVFNQDDTREWLERSGFDKFETEGFGECFGTSFNPIETS